MHTRSGVAVKTIETRSSVVMSLRRSIASMSSTTASVISAGSSAESRVAPRIARTGTVSTSLSRRLTLAIRR